MTGNIQGEEEQLFHGYSGRLLVTCSLGWVGLSVGRFVISPLLPIIIESLSITRFQAGMAVTVLWGLYAVSQYPSGRFSDQLSRKPLLVSGVALIAAGFAFLVGSINYFIFVVGMATIGIGSGTFATPTKALISDLFTIRRGQAFGVQTAASDLGGALAGSLAVVALAVASWRTAFLPVVALLVVTLLMLHFWSRESYSFMWVSFNVRETGRRLITDARTRNLMVAYALFSFTWQGVVTFLPAFLQAEKGFSLGFASAVFTLLFVVGIVIKPIAGVLSDRLTRTPVAAGALIVAIIGLASLVLFQSILLIIISVLVFAVGFSAVSPVLQAHLMDIFPNENAGGDMGATRTVYLGIGSLGPTYVGLAAGLADYKTAFIGLTVCLFLSTVITLSMVNFYKIVP
jgi:MFS family permease